MDRAGEGADLCVKGRSGGRSLWIWQVSRSSSTERARKLVGRALWIGQVSGSSSLDWADYGVELCG